MDKSTELIECRIKKIIKARYCNSVLSRNPLLWHPSRTGICTLLTCVWAEFWSPEFSLSCDPCLSNFLQGCYFSPQEKRKSNSPLTPQPFKEVKTLLNSLSVFLFKLN